MTPFDTIFHRALDERAARGLRRRLRALTPDGAGYVRCGAQRLLDLSSNDYLGLASHPALCGRAAAWGARYGAGARASRLVSGTLPVLEALEARIASFKGCEAALVLGSGWQANAGVVAALLSLSAAETGHPPLVFTDRLIHASLHYGIHAAGVRQIRFRHNDLDHLAALLDRHADRPGLRFVLTESVFSMDGDVADIGALRALTARHGAFLYVDEAHATGVLGPGGRGLAATHGADLVMGTFSKALGGYGAYVAGSRALCDWLCNACSALIYATALPPSVIGAIDAALDLLPAMDKDRARLQENAALLRARLQAAGLQTGASTTQIVPVMIGEADHAVRTARMMETHGVLAVAIRPPTVPPGTARLRLALSAAHDASAIADAAEIVIAAVRHAGQASA